MADQISTATKVSNQSPTGAVSKDGKFSPPKAKIYLCSNNGFFT